MIELRSEVDFFGIKIEFMVMAGITDVTEMPVMAIIYLPKNSCTKEQVKNKIGLEIEVK